MDENALLHPQDTQQESLTLDWVRRHRSNNSDDDNEEAHRGLASSLYLLCLALLRQIFLQRKSSKKGSNALREELGKFYLWGHELADRKLDRALEYSKDIKSEVLDSLSSVGRAVLRAYSSPNTANELNLPQATRQELRRLVEQARTVADSRELELGLGDVGEDSESDTEDEDDVESSYDGVLVRKLAQHTSWLTQLSSTIEQDYVRAKVRQKRAVYPPVVPFSVSGPALFYVGLVQDKFPTAERKLVERFGEANWQRHINIRNQLDPDTPTAEKPAAHSVFRPHSAFHDSGIGTSVPAHTTYAASHTSFRSTASESARGSVSVPETPVEVNAGKPFQCFLCKTMLSNIKDREHWKMHVFSDLQPYICTFRDCPNELAQFPSRALWANHEFSQHRILQSWKCPECREKLASESEWEDHVCTQHELKLLGKDLQMAKDAAHVIEEAVSVDGEECPLCHKVLHEARRGYMKHVGNHMEEIALMTLPRNVDEDEDQVHEQSDGGSYESSPTRVSPRPQSRTQFSDSSMGPPWPKAETKAAAAKAAAAAAPPPKEKDKPIKFKDAVGRRFNFPFHLCATWTGMEFLIKEAFVHLPGIGPHVAEGHYDLLGPHGEIILPHVWETVIEPNWTITMHMWPMVEEKEEEPAPPPPPDITPVEGVPPPPPPAPTAPGNMTGEGHSKAAHSGPRDKTFQCSYKSCTKEFKRKDRLSYHCKKVHNRDLPAEYGGTGSKLSR